METSAEPASQDEWLLVRNARQLLTLQGNSGPRRGIAMNDLGVIPHGALLIRNGVIEHVGSSRRLENLREARLARELDATHKIVLPAFVDADVALFTPSETEQDYDGTEAAPRKSRKDVTQIAEVTAAECARYGALSVGAHTRFARDLSQARKLLRAHQNLQRRPLRIRSIYSPDIAPDANGGASPDTVMRGLASIRLQKLSALLEINLSGNSADAFSTSLQAWQPARPVLRAVAEAASGLGYAIRLRSTNCTEPADLQLALAAGAVAIVSPLDRLRAFAGPLGGIGCVRVIPASEAFDDPMNAAQSIRRGLSDGLAIALASSYRPRHVFSMNMQHLLHLAVQFLGMTDEEAITALTWNAACSLRLSHVAGSLEPGKPADVVLMDVSDYRELARRAGHHDIHLVIRAGKVIYRSASLSTN